MLYIGVLIAFILFVLNESFIFSYWLFRSWGRIGTTIGSTKLESLPLEEAIDTFEELYLDKSGNSWQNRDHFVKVPGRMYPMEVEYGNASINVFQELYFETYHVSLTFSLLVSTVLFYFTCVGGKNKIGRCPK